MPHPFVINFLLFAFGTFMLAGAIFVLVIIYQMLKGEI